VVERIFGVVKKRFPILKRTTDNLSIETQGKLVIALFTLHNFIQSHQSKDLFVEEYYEQVNESTELIDNNINNPVNLEESNDSAGSKLRDEIAEQMWNDYLEITANRRASYLQ
jgi:hypothetical protein